MLGDIGQQRRSRTLAACGAISLTIACAGWLAFASYGVAQDATESDQPSQPSAPAAKPRHKPLPRHAKPLPKAAAVRAADPVSAPAADDASGKAAAPSFAPDFAAQLRKAGAGACGSAVDALAGTTMANVASFNTLSSWSTTAGNSRAVSLEIGQKYPEGSAVPFGASAIVAAPNTRGSCDAYAVQVVPSPLSCDALRQSLARGGQQIAQLAGVPVMQTGADHTMLVPTKGNTCVLVATRSRYAQ